MALNDYMSRYDHEHHNPWNRLLHGIGIPIILASVVMVVLGHWRSALSLFIGGWVLLFLGHRIEGNRPAFFQGPLYFLVGPLWIAREIKEMFARRPADPSAS